MSEKTRRRIGTSALCLGLAALHLILMLTALHAVSTDDALYFSLQTRGDETFPWDYEINFSVCRDDLLRLDRALSDYLKGDETALDITVDVYGVPQPAFNDRERAHMADCLHLFALLRKVRARLIPWAIVLTLGGAWLLQDRKRARLCAWVSPLLVLLPLGGFALFAALNFDQAFTLFHKILFTNDLWLLNPATDLLIRICPESMFMHMGLRILLYSLLGMLMAWAAVTELTFIWPGEKEENPWKKTTPRGPAPRLYDFRKRGTR